MYALTVATSNCILYNDWTKWLQDFKTKNNLPNTRSKDMSD